MPKKPAPKSPLQELADQADAAMHLCWQRLGAKDLTHEDIVTLVNGWRIKRLAHLESAEVKAEKKEQKASDNG